MAHDLRMESIMWDYVSFLERIQKSPSGLGEPKHNVDGSPFNEGITLTFILHSYNR